MPYFDTLGKLIERCLGGFSKKLTGPDRQEISSLLIAMSDLLNGEDKEYFRLKAKAIECGYSNELLIALNACNQKLSIVIGNISTWFGKTVVGRSTAFAGVTCKEIQDEICFTNAESSGIASLLDGLNKNLFLSEVPRFDVVDLVFMVGEGNSHPKHIAYFLPEDEGFKNSKIKRTHYLSNVHLSLIKLSSIPFVNDLSNIVYDIPNLKVIAALGVLAHEYGHFITLKNTDYTLINSDDRWLSVTLQETSADVFGFLVLAEVWSLIYGFRRQDVVTYQLGEMLRYVNRGFGLFPDSDGMVIQLNYLLSNHAITFNDATGTLEVNDVDLFIASYRSLARMLTETLLSNDLDGMKYVSDQYGPGSLRNQRIKKLFDTMSESNVSSLEYIKSID